MTVTLYGIPNCDTVKAARKWLAENEIEYAFHDYKKTGVVHSQLVAWIDELGWENLLNRSGTTFRKLPDHAKAHINAMKAAALMMEQPSTIKRPVLDLGERRVLGFKPEDYRAAFAKV